MDKVNIKSDSDSGSSSKQLTFGVDRILSNDFSSKKSGKFSYFFIYFNEFVINYKIFIFIYFQSQLNK